LFAFCRQTADERPDCSHPQRRGMHAVSSIGSPYGRPERNPMSKRLFVGNLSYSVSETDLQDRFAPYGATSATIPSDFDGRSKGFGFVDVSEDQMDAAISAWNGKEVDGRALNVNEARPRPERGSGGGGGSYGGGGGGRSGGYNGGGGGGRW